MRSDAHRPATGSTPSPWRHLPNAITLARIGLVAPLVWLIAQHRFDGALLVVAAAGASDALDGLIARQFGWRSWLGGVLDPIADKLLLIASFVSLCAAGVLPSWLAWLVVGRDLVIIVGAICYHVLIGRVIPQPSLLSKITTCVQITCVLALLVRLGGAVALPPASIDALFGLTALATIASGVHYVLVWSRKANRERAEGK